MTQTITQPEAARMIRESNGKLFSVTFVKRKDGSLRRMVARVAPKGGWKTGVTGQGMPYNPSDHYLIPLREFVTDPNRGQRGRVCNLNTSFKSIPVDGIVELRTGGKVFTVIPVSSRPSPF